MAHSLSMGGIRSLAYAIILVLKSLYNRIYVNEEGVQMASSLSRYFLCSIYLKKLDSLKALFLSITPHTLGTTMHEIVHPCAADHN